jgi:hypothetical protein
MANSIAWSVVAACLIFLTMFFAIGDSPIVEREPVVVDPVIDTFSSPDYSGYGVYDGESCRLYNGYIDYGRVSYRG